MDRGWPLLSSVADDNTGPSEQGVALLELLQASGPALLLLEQRLPPLGGSSELRRGHSSLMVTPLG